MAAALVAVQAFLGGLALAQTAIAVSPDFAGFAIICHGGSAGGDDGTAPDPIKAGHLCCPSCTAGGPPAVLARAPIVLCAAYDRPCKPVAVSSGPISIAARAIRAGLSQAPPSRA
jgi:hypothetical protein